MSNDEKQATQTQPSKKLGLVAAPDLAEDIAYKLTKEIPDFLTHYVDDISWEIKVVTDPLTGATADSPRIIEETKEWKKQEGWDYAICITDLPIFIDRRLIVADADTTEKLAWISLPALGAAPMLRRVREAILQLTNEMYHGSSDEARDHQQKRLKNARSKNRAVRSGGARQLIKERLSERLSPIRRVTVDDKNCDIDVRYTVNSKVSGGIRMLSGMVRANRPWAILPSFKRVVVAAFATGAYGLIFPTLWRLSGSYGITRSFLLMLAAMAAMIAWIIIAHGLWEKTSKATSPFLAKLYNFATVLTLTIAVLVYYGVLFILFFVAVIIFVPGDMLEVEIGEPVNLINYVYLAWIVSSVATLAGALGAALESEETVYNATYGHRQRRRYEEMANKSGKPKGWR